MFAAAGARMLLHLVPKLFVCIGRSKFLLERSVREDEMTAVGIVVFRPSVFPGRQTNLVIGDDAASSSVHQCDGTVDKEPTDVVAWVEPFNGVPRNKVDVVFDQGVRDRFEQRLEERNMTG